MRFGLNAVLMLCVGASSCGRGLPESSPSPSPSTDGGGEAPDSATPSAVSDAGNADAPAEDGAAEPAYVAAVREDDPHAYYRLEELDGEDARDGSKGARHGKYRGNVKLGVGGAFVGSRALELDGTNGGVISGLGGNLFEHRRPFTIELWFKPSTIDATSRFLASFEGTSPSGRQSVAMNVTSAALRIERWVNGVRRMIGGDVPSVDTFHHIVMTYDGVGGQLFIDGAFQVGFDDPNDQPPTTATLCFGLATPTSNEALIGVIDEVAVYDKVLPSPRIRAHYDAAANR